MKTYLAGLIPQRVKNLLHLLEAVIANVRFGFPARKLRVIGVTGTDGKTTTCYLVHSILTEAGIPAGLITTIESKIGQESCPTGLHVTTPRASDIQRYLKKMHHQSCEFVVLETTSHGLDQHRLWGIDFDIGVLTNVSHEHLDYHHNLKNYRAAKAKLFQKAQTAVLNYDDDSYEYFADMAVGKVVGYGLSYREGVHQRHLEGINFKMPGEYNRYNALAAIAVARQLGISTEAIKTGLERISFLPGRMEVVQERPFKVIVDFAHTPNGLKNALTAAKDEVQPDSKLHLVFGCAGLRDQTKRPEMGRIAAQWADHIYLTAEDPRTENLSAINEQIFCGAASFSESQSTKDYSGQAVRENQLADGTRIWRFNEPSPQSRVEAIKRAIEQAEEGDVVLITGKGHEESLCFGNSEHPWSDRDTTIKLLEEA